MGETRTEKRDWDTSKIVQQSHYCMSMPQNYSFKLCEKLRVATDDSVCTDSLR